eukprot:14493256-Alexandrium_andersonii.AAC.1
MLFPAGEGRGLNQAQTWPDWRPLSCRDAAPNSTLAPRTLTGAELDLPLLPLRPPGGAGAVLLV